MSFLTKLSAAALGLKVAQSLIYCTKVALISLGNIVH